MEGNLKPVEYLREVFPGLSRDGAYRVVRENPDIRVRLGRKIFVRKDRVEQLIERGGKSLAGGWRRELPPVEIKA